SGESKLAAYISSNGWNSSILNQLTPIVFYLEHNLQQTPKDQEQITQQQETSTAASSEPSSSEPSSSQPVSTEPILETTSPPIEPSQTTIASTESAVLESSSVAAAAATPVLLSKIEQLVSAGSYSRNQIMDYNYLIDTFYVVDKSTSLPQEILNPALLLSKDL